MTIIAQLIFLEGILSIDNAAVLGALVVVLSEDKAVPYPRAMHFLQGITDRLFGAQQAAALKVGLFGAYLGRGLMLLAAAWVIRNPALQILGALYLVKLAFEHLSTADQPGEEEYLAEHRRRETGFWLVVLNVELADLAFSVDNVVAAVALSSHFWVVMLGVAIGILLMRFAAGIFTWLIKREPILETAAYIVVLNIGLQLLLSEFAGLQFEPWQKFLISLVTLGLCVVYARVRFLHFLGPAFTWLGQGMGNLNELADWLLRPFTTLIKLLFSSLQRVGSHLPGRTADASQTRGG